MDKIKVSLIIAAAMIGLSVGAVTQIPEKTLGAPAAAPAKTPAAPAKPAETAEPKSDKTYTRASSLDIVARPGFYLNKYITVKGKFDKFSTLGLDYKPAYRSSESYISFLIQRDDVKDHNIPLSEFKIFIPRKEAEKYIDMNAGDEIEFSGKVFSTALGDAWFDVEKFAVLSAKAKPVNK